MSSLNINRTRPIHHVVSAAMIDLYGDISQAGLQQTLLFNAARGFRKINNEILKNGRRKATIHVNRNTHTATLPIDFYEESFVGIIDDMGRKIPLRLRTDLTDTENIEDIPCEDKCPQCNQNKNICKELSITESTVIVVINNTTYEKTIIKKLYPNGDYFLESNTPVYDVITNTVVYVAQKEFVRHLELKDCGCLSETEENLEFIRINNFDCYCSYFAPCCDAIIDGSYQIFEETGLIKFNSNFKYSKVYIEYQGFLPKKNGQYHVPEICFETLVQWIKWKSVENKRNVSLSERNFVWEHYLIERGNLEKLNGRFSLQNVIQSIGLIPKFDIEWHRDDSCYTPKQEVMTTSNTCETQSISCPPTSGKSFIPFSILTAAGNNGSSPIVGSNTYQDDRFKNAIGINTIILNDTTFTRNEYANQSVKDFSIDVVNGVLTLFQGDGVSPRNFDTGDVLVVPTFFKLI
jgi:hypothetical protein